MSVEALSTGLTISDLTAGYGKRQVLREMLAAPIAPGQVVALIGPNAAGKSTLLRALMGLLQPAAESRLTLFGQDLLALGSDERVRLTGYLPQSLPQRSTLLAYELVMSAARSMPVMLEGDRQSVEHQVDTVFAELGISDLAMKRMAEMSGGQRQMVGLAQVLIRAPRLLLLDEPTSALDLRWQLRVLDVVRRKVQADGAICLMAIHDLNLALRFADGVILLGPDGLLASGDPRQVLTSDLVSEAFGIRARLETCSQGYPIVLADQAMPDGVTQFPSFAMSSQERKKHAGF